MVLFQLEILHFGVALIADTIDSFLVLPTECLHVGGALVAHTLTALPAMVPPNGQVEYLLANLALLQLMETHLVWVEGLGQAIIFQQSF